MKRTIFMLSVLLTTSLSFSQIKVVENTPKEFVGKITPGGIKTIECEKAGDVYIFSFKDAKFTRIESWQSFTIKDVDNAFESLYTVIQKGFDEMPKEAIQIEIPDGTLFIEFDKFLGSKIFSFVLGKDGNMYESAQYTKKQVDKLFGKNK